MGPVGISDNAKVVGKDCKTLLQRYHHSAAAADCIEGLTKTYVTSEADKVSVWVSNQTHIVDWSLQKYIWAISL
jgi:hypothetical protein